MGVGWKLRRLLKGILQEDEVVVFNGIRELDPLTQTTGVAQGDCLSSLLFVLLLAELPREIAKEVRSVQVLLYADDLVIYGERRIAVQMAVNALEKFCQGKGLHINEEKTVAMKFRGGGRLSKCDKMWVKGVEIPFENEVTYLGIKLRSCGSYEGHIRERVRKAKVAIARVRKPQMLGMGTALRVFGLCIAPVVSYGIPVIWEKLNEKHLAALESVKASFLKRSLGVAAGTKNRVVYSLVGTGSFIEDVRTMFKLELTHSATLYLQSFQEKIRGVESEGVLGQTLAMTTRRWREPGRPGRSLVIRVSVHGLHGEFCWGKGCFVAGEGCRCRYCGGECRQYHLWDCPAQEGVQFRRSVTRAQNECVVKGIYDM